MTEGFFLDPRPKSLGNDPIDLRQNFGIDNATIFVQPFGSQGQPYVIFSDNPSVSEPGTLVLFGTSALALLAILKRRKKLEVTN